MLTPTFQTHKNTPLHRTLNLVNNPTEFEERCFEEIGGWPNERLFKRLGLWLDYFNEAYVKYLGIYSATALAVVEYYNREGLMFSQSKVEFDTSILFYEALIATKPCLQINAPEVATYLLGVALFFGNFPGLVVCSKYSAFGQLPDAPSIDDVRRLFERLFVKHETTPFLLNHLPLLTVYEANVYSSLLAGRSLRRIHGLPYRPSQKECYLFYTKAPENICFTDRILDRSLIYCRVLKAKPDFAVLLMQLLSVSKIFSHYPDRVAEDIEFWQHVLVVLSSQECFGLQAYVDYFEYIRYESSTPDATLYKTLEGIERDIRKWHASVQYQLKGKNVNYSWESKVAIGRTQWVYNEHYQIKELTTGNELVQESIELEHCVFSYIQYCYKNQTSIWSLQKKEGGSYKSQVTIEVKDNAIIQASGKQNRELSSEEEKIIKKWGREYEFLYDLF